MRILATAALFLLALPACIELDEELITQTPADTSDGVPQEGPSRPDREEQEDTGLPVDTVVSPSSAALCDTLLVSVVAETAGEIEDIRFFGPSDIEVLTFDVRNDEVLVTITTDGSGDEGLNDLLLEIEGGDALFLEDAFEVSGSECGS